MSLPTTLLESDSDTASIVSRSFNAWGPDGELQRRFADSAASSSSSSSSMVGFSHAAASVAEEDPNVVGELRRAHEFLVARWGGGVCPVVKDSALQGQGSHSPA
ncbi:hypothetical protein G3M48_003374 [Beauveria asiatica]|uniref:Uncharacterized protein n=1 Tax=Beauveria asiatica TaxID=1069075 RepID=A0AAW0RW81_9HYPO